MKRAAVVIALALALTSQVAARSEAVVRGPVQQRIDELAHRLNSRIVVGSIVPAGLWGVELRGVEIRPHTVAPREGDLALVTIDAIRLYPRLGSLLEGDPEVRRVVIDTPRVLAVLDSDGSPHADWFDWLTHEIRSRRAPIGGAVGPSGVSRVALPDIEVRGGFVTLYDPSGRYPSMGTRIDELRLGSVGQASDGAPSGAQLRGSVTIDGLGRGIIDGRFGGGEGPRVALRFIEDNDVFPLLPFEVAATADAQLSVGAVEFDWPPHLVLRDVRCSGLDAPLPALDGRHLNEVVAGAMTVSIDTEGLSMATVDVELRFGGGGDGLDLSMATTRLRHPWGATSTTVVMELVDDDRDRLTVVVERAADGSAVSARARAAGYDLASLLRLAPEDGPARVLAGTFSGTVGLEWSRADRYVRAVIGGRLERLSIDAPLLSEEALHGIDLALEVNAELQRRSGDLLVQRARLLIPSIGLSARGDAAIAHDRVTLDLRASMSPRPAQELLRALPYGVVPVLHGFRFEGDFGFDARVAVDTADLDGLVADVRFDTETLEVLQFGPLAPLDRISDPDFTWRINTFEGDTRLVGRRTGSWVSIDEIPNHVYRSVIAAEDDRFWLHSGLDPAAIVSALRANLEAGRVVRGGSTISQQVVKNLFLNHERTLSRKLQEAFLTWQLERILPKESILELYINLVHWGPGIYGLGDAAVGYFNHLPQQLTLRESIFLASILPSPALFGEQYTRRIIPPSRRQKMEHILANLHGAGYLSRQSLRFHTRMVHEGRISNTPPPTQLGTHRGVPASAGPQLGALFFLP